MPDSVHAVSVALPRWQDVVGYEEKRPAVMTKLAGGYPRFVIHPLVQEMARTLGQGKPALPFPSARAAASAAAFVRQAGSAGAEVVARAGWHGVVTDERGFPSLRGFWQHAGLIVSSRQAQALLAGRGAPLEDGGVRKSLREQLAGFYDCAAADVLLAPTGMAALQAALAVVSERTAGQPTVQLGFPYVDTLKLQQKLGPGATLLHKLDRVAADLERLLARRSVAACFCEIPGNPLLGSADVREVSPLLRAQGGGIPLVVDDVVATPINTDFGPYADLIATSLTKYIAGSGDVMGGALICNPRSPLHAELRAIATRQHEELLWGEDAAVLDAQARGFPERMAQHNRGGLLLAERLRQHPAVERVWYPRWENREAYNAVRRPAGGWGGLITFLPRRAEVTSPRIYDRLALCKGPSLGTVFTLVCPFTMLAHYAELDWAEGCGVSRYLIRISVGLEDPEELWRRLSAALTEA
jgi:cystathionine gamma-synthase